MLFIIFTKISTTFYTKALNSVVFDHQIRSILYSHKIENAHAFHSKLFTCEGPRYLGVPLINSTSSNCNLYWIWFYSIHNSFICNTTWSWPAQCESMNKGEISYKKELIKIECEASVTKENLQSNKNLEGVIDSPLSTS